MKEIEISIKKQLKEQTCLSILNRSSQRMMVKLMIKRALYIIILIESHENVLVDLPDGLEMNAIEVIDLDKERRIPLES